MNTFALIVPPSPEHWIQAAGQLIRPSEVIGLAQAAHGCTFFGTFAERLASYLRIRFLLGLYAYRSDPRNTDLWYSPAETLSRGHGDCEDWALVVSSALELVGSEYFMVIGRASGLGHAWVEGRDENGYFVLECTSGALHRHRPPGYEPIVFTTKTRFQLAS